MSFRRFVYLVTEDVGRPNFLLRRIDMSRFFFPKGKRDELDPPLLEEAELPPVALRFDPPTSDVGNHHMQFMLFPGGDNGRNDKVVATDLTGRVILYDPESHSVRSAPSFSVPKFAPISLAVGGVPISLAGGGGNSYYILDRDFTLNSHDRDACFHRFFHDDDWHCQYLPPPPYARAYRDDSMSHVESYAVVGGSNILVSKDTLGTHCYDTARHLWTKAGDWVLPFRGHVQYVPDHKLWFGFPSADSGKEDEGSIYASDLTVTPPTSCKVWADDLTPAECYSKSSYLVHLGHSKFCHARFFCVKLPFDLDYQSYVVFTGMEAEVCSNSGGELRVVKHRSEQYRLVDKIVHWLL